MYIPGYNPRKHGSTVSHNVPTNSEFLIYRFFNNMYQPRVTRPFCFVYLDITYLR